MGSWGSPVAFGKRMSTDEKKAVGGGMLAIGGVGAVKGATEYQHGVRVQAAHDLKIPKKLRGSQRTKIGGLAALAGGAYLGVKGLRNAARAPETLTEPVLYTKGVADA